MLNVLSSIMQPVNNVYKEGPYYSTLRQRHGAWFGTRMRKVSAVSMSNLFTLVIEVKRQLQPMYLTAFGDQSPFILPKRFVQRSWNHLHFYSKKYVLFISYIQPRRKPTMVHSNTLVVWDTSIILGSFMTLRFESGYVFTLRWK